ncbi:hypothetical protein BAMA_23250 [Bacillus manliponensis]|uniref:Lipoprotein n=1 Tax=Bacillus manliponensis TaxID=574376 RepID=A0A073JYE2_9BACI|nr:lipoprotein BA_5634 family protein [Bacillus manliponensis]KEK19296.1 hypothetical protein BAMA_23250 [Bacillus manliponensis]
MKKLVRLSLAAAISMSALTGCGLLGEKANGFVLYGTETQVQAVADKEKPAEKDMYKMKVVNIDDKKVLVMDQKTADELMKKELLKKVENDKTTAIDKLPTVTENQGVLFAKEEMTNVALDGYALKYEGNVIIGDGRSYADMFAVVENGKYASVNGEETTVGVLKFEKDPAKQIPKGDEVDAQLVKIKE